MPVILQLFIFFIFLILALGLYTEYKRKPTMESWQVFARLAEMTKKSDEEIKEKYMNRKLDIYEIIDELESSDNIPCNEYGEWIRGLVELNERVQDCASEEFQEAYKNELRSTYDYFKEFVEPDEIGVNEVGDTYESLLAFKQYVHKRLDDAGIPVDPDPAKTQSTGCRVGVRLDQILNHIKV